MLTVGFPTDQTLTPDPRNAKPCAMEWLLSPETMATFIATAGATVFLAAWRWW
jgi:hypothetical protein